MSEFYRGETYAIIQAMKASGNRPGVIAQWKKQVEDWALGAVNSPDAVSVRALLPFWQVRPFYTAEELAPIWPALAIAIGRTSHWPNVLKSPKRLATELDFVRHPSIVVKHPVTGLLDKFYIVERIHYWTKKFEECDLKEFKEEFYHG